LFDQPNAKHMNAYRLLLYMPLFAIVITACSSPKYKNPHVKIKTTYGVIEAELYPDSAPKSVAAFLRYVDSGYYNNTSFYRVLNDENQATGVAHSQLIQGGLFGTNDQLSDRLPPIPHETTQQTGLHHELGTLSLARQEPGTAGTEFFICVEAQPGFDFGGSNNSDGQGYAAFGKVVEGMDVVRKIQARPTNGEMFKSPIAIVEIKRL
jgi:peptidyl-prolyl cis-trans isomerase A (cyclophilin A)